MLNLLLTEGENGTTDVIAFTAVKRVPLLKMTLFLGAQIKPLVKLIHATCCFQGYAEFLEFLSGDSANWGASRVAANFLEKDASTENLHCFLF